MLLQHTRVVCEHHVHQDVLLCSRPLCYVFLVHIKPRMLSLQDSGRPSRPRSGSHQRRRRPRLRAAPQRQRRRGRAAVQPGRRRQRQRQRAGLHIRAHGECEHHAESCMCFGFGRRARCMLTWNICGPLRTRDRFPGDTLAADPSDASGAQSSRRGSSTNLGSGRYASVPAALAVESDGESEQGAGRGGVAGWFRRQH